MTLVATEHVTDAEIVGSPDDAHSRLVKAIARIESDYWGLADAIVGAYNDQAWLRDGRAHEARYRNIMREKNLPSIFEAYAFDEFGIKRAYIYHQLSAGRLRHAVGPVTDVTAPDWARFTIGALRPISTAIVETHEGDALAAALVLAQRKASDDSAKHPRPGHHDHDNAPVKPSHVRAALAELGMVPPRNPTLDELEAGERRTARLDRAEKRVRADLPLLIAERRRKAAVEIIVSAIRRLADHPASLAAIRAEFDQ